MARAQRLLLAVICAVLVAPLLLVEMPPILDYPNHLARLFLVGAVGHDAILAAMARVRWAIIPNLAVDLLGLPLLRVFPVHVAGRLLIGLAVLLPVLGTVAYHRAVFRRFCWWPLASALVAYNAALLLGFLNFEIAIGLALLLAAGWIRFGRGRPRLTLAVAALGAVVLFFSHLMGLAFFGVLIAAWEAEMLWREGWARGRPWWRLARLALVFVLPLGLFLSSPFKQAQGELGWLPLPMKLVQLVFPFLNVSFSLDVVTAVLVIGFFLACMARRWSGFPPHSAAALGLLGLLCAAAPFGFKGTMALDARFAIMVGFLTFAGMSPFRLPGRVARPAMAVLGALFLVRMAVLGLAWHAHAEDLAQMRAVIAAVPPGATVDVSTVTRDEAPDYWRHVPWGRQLSDGSALDAHSAALLLIERRAFWPFLFADEAQQPIALRPDYQRLADSTGGMRPHRQLDDSVCGFDFLLLLDAGGEPNLVGWGGRRLTLVVARDAAALFRVTGCGKQA